MGSQVSDARLRHWVDLRAGRGTKEMRETTVHEAQSAIFYLIIVQASLIEMHAEEKRAGCGRRMSLWMTPCHRV